MIVSPVPAVLLAVLFVLLGVSKLLALPHMRELAAHAGFSVAAYRGIGALEVAGAAGLLLGLTVPLLGACAGVGLLLLLVAGYLSVLGTSS
jgi:uncharacterized membrane protein